MDFSHFLAALFSQPGENRLASMLSPQGRPIYPGQLVRGSGGNDILPPTQQQAGGIGLPSINNAPPGPAPAPTGWGNFWSRSYSPTPQNLPQAQPPQNPPVRGWWSGERAGPQVQPPTNGYPRYDRR
jgi:hypothetical protein